MKKFIAVILALTLTFSFAACGAKPESQPAEDQTVSNTETVESTESTESEETESTETAAEADAELMEYFDSLVGIVQPGTTGSSTKAIAAVTDIILWAKENTADKAVVAASLKEYLATSEYGEEALTAFEMIESVISSIMDGTATDILEGSEEGFYDFTGKAGEIAQGIIEALEEYKAEQE